MKKIGLFIIYTLVIVSFLTTQLTGDFMVFWAYAKQVNNSTCNGLAAIVDIWELKGLLFKLFLYGNYMLTSLFSNDYSLFCQFVYKSFALLVYLAILDVGLVAIPQRYIARIGRFRLFLITTILLLTTHFASHFQAEMWGVLFMLVALSLYLRNNLVFKIIAAIIYSLTFYLKSPMPLLGGTLFFGIMLIKKQNLKYALKEMLPFVLTTILFLSVTLSLLYKYYPQEINDIWDASYYQGTLFHNGEYLSALKSLVVGIIKNGVFYNVTCALGFMASLWLIFHWIKLREAKFCFILIGTWIFPLIYIALSNCYFVYHYYLMVLPALISLYVFYNEYEMTPKFLRLLKIAIGTYLCYYIVVLSSVAYTNIYIKSEFTQKWKDNKYQKNMYIGYRLDSKEVLFLDDGQGAFIFDNKSYLRYFYPLPLQRIKANNPFTKTETYKAVKEKVMSYGGEYLTLYDEWFFSNGNDDIRQKINKEYELCMQIDVPKLSWTIFSINKEKPKSIWLYKRKYAIAVNTRTN